MKPGETDNGKKLLGKFDTFFWKKSICMHFSEDSRLERTDLTTELGWQNNSISIA